MKEGFFECAARKNPFFFFSFKLSLVTKSKTWYFYIRWGHKIFQRFELALSPAFPEKAKGLFYCKNLS
jgi:hypothetical protein